MSLSSFAIRFDTSFIYRINFKYSSPQQTLRDSLKPLWTKALRGRIGISIENCLYVTLWKLYNSDVTLRDLIDRFSVGKGTTHKIYYKIIGLMRCLKYEIT